MVPHKAYAIYRRKTKMRRSGRPVYRYYYQLWDEEKRKYGPANSTGQTSRTAAEVWLAKHLQQEQQSTLTVTEFATGMFDEGSSYLTYRQVDDGCSSATGFSQPAIVAVVRVRPSISVGQQSVVGYVI